MNEVTPAALAAPAPAASGRADLVYVLLLLQAALGALAAVGVVFLMGSLLYAVAPALQFVLLAVLAAAVARGRRRALWGVVVVETVTLAGYHLNLLLALLPQVDVTVNLVGLLTSVGLPLAVLWQCARLLVQRP